MHEHFLYHSNQNSSYFFQNKYVIKVQKFSLVHWTLRMTIGIESVSIASINRYHKLTTNLMKCSYSCETSKKFKKSTPKYTMLRFMLSHSKLSDTELFYMQYFSIWFIHNAIFVCIICSTLFLYLFFFFLVFYVLHWVMKSIATPKWFINDNVCVVACNKICSCPSFGLILDFIRILIGSITTIMQ